jgi:predicted phage terminase large subunit-like protein
VITLPALAEDGDPLGRAPGAALCPERYDEEQRPTPKAGEIFDPAWFRIVDAPPAHAMRVRWWDMAATESGGDYTAGVRVSVTPDGVFTVEHIARGQWAPGRRDATIRQTAELDGAAVVQWGEQEPGSAGKSQALAFVKLLAGFTAYTAPSTGDKIVRAGPLAAQAQAGNVQLVRGEWNRHFLEELRQFPHGTHDDQVDAAASALNQLARRQARKALPPTVVYQSYR